MLDVGRDFFRKKERRRGTQFNVIQSFSFLCRGCFCFLSKWVKRELTGRKDGIKQLEKSWLFCLQVVEIGGERHKMSFVYTIEIVRFLSDRVSNTYLFLIFFIYILVCMFFVWKSISLEWFEHRSTASVVALIMSVMHLPARFRQFF